MPADEDEHRVRRADAILFCPGCGRMTIYSAPLMGHWHSFSQRFELFHRMIRFVFGNKIYVGPVEKVLSPNRDPGVGERLRVLDLGTGSGLW